MDARNPFELGLDNSLILNAADFIGKAALKQVQQQGIVRQQIGPEIDGEPLSGPNTVGVEMAAK